MYAKPSFVQGRASKSRALKHRKFHSQACYCVLKLRRFYILQNDFRREILSLPSECICWLSRMTPEKLFAGIR